MALRAVEQLAFDETVVEDDDLEEALEERDRLRVLSGEQRKALEERDRLRVLSGEQRKAFGEAHEKANVEIAKQELPDGQVMRVGRFRITRSSVPARSVSFETDAKSRVRITVVGEDDA